MATTNPPHDCRDDEGNCTAHRDHDGMIVQCVRPWALEKHHYLRQYLTATSSVRRLFNEEGPRAGSGFIDLFPGNGRARVFETGEFIDGSSMIAVNETSNPFTRIALADICPVNVEALRCRTQGDHRVEVVEGDCNETIAQIIDRRLIPRHGYNVAFLDPYAPSALAFPTVRRLADYPHMDLIIHFPTGTFRRNFDRTGTAGYYMGESVTMVRPEDVAILMRKYRENLDALGYQHHEVEVRAPAIMNTVGVTMYHLMFASKNQLGDKIWNSVTKHRANHPQLNLL
jgi:three-Cys-motif partner protein